MKIIKQPLFALLLILCMTNCSNGVFDRECKKDLKEIMFYDGFKNQSTSTDFIIFTARDNNTKKIKEICCVSTDLSNALVLEHSRLYPGWIILTKPCRKVFKFKYENSLEAIDFDKYDTKIVDSLDKVLPNSLFEKIRQNTIKRNYKLVWYYDSLYNHKNYFEHLLLRHNIRCYRDCESGCTVTYLIKSGT